MSLPFAAHFQLVAVGSILAYMLTLVHSAWQSWWLSISRHILFCKYFLLQFIDIWSCFVLFVQISHELNSGNHRRAFQRKRVMGTHQSNAYLSTRQGFFKCLECCFLLPIREKLLTESQPNIALMARSKQQVYKPHSDASECIGIISFRYHSLVWTRLSLTKQD